MTLKSGTNNFHGNVFEFLRNNVLDANGFFQNRSAATAKRSPFKRNIFGGTIGGPIIKNKLFFFGDYEGMEQRGEGTGTASVAPADWRTAATGEKRSTWFWEAGTSITSLRPTPVSR